MILGSDLLNCVDLKEYKISPEQKFSITTDSRSISNQNLFVSLYGPNFDSINFVGDVFSKGVEKVVLENRSQNSEKIEKLKNEYGKDNIYVVTDVFKFLLELGQIRSRRFQRDGGVVIGITGSNGKTTNKEMLRHLLNYFGEEKVWSTRGNLNNQIGVPLTIFELNDDHKIAVIEMGTNFPGEIEVLARCAIPKFGYITNIGHAHIEFLKSLEGVFEEKSALYREVVKREDGVFLINGFDAFLKRHQGKDRTFFVGEETLNLTENGFSLEIEGLSVRVENPSLLGNHQKINMGMCLSLVAHIFPENVNDFVERAKSYRPPGMNRGEVVVRGDSTFYMDAYNANPNSMKASLASYVAYLRQKGLSESDATFILGDMNELGDSSEELHAEIGKELKKMDVQSAIFVGRFSKYYLSGFGNEGKSFDNVAQLKEYFEKSQDWPKQLFVKGSRSLQLESILDITDR